MWNNRKEQPLTLEEDHEFAQHVAEESIVLLKMKKKYYRLRKMKRLHLSADL